MTRNINRMTSVEVELEMILVDEFLIELEAQKLKEEFEYEQMLAKL